ncbi:MAG: Na/Pi cotransporter family protein [Paludibacteraceae bacterium]|nr:Na/Pi cotransporter family protein [Paludibacteraceae bacterium]
MDFGLIDLLTLIGSIGLFLYGMKLMSEGLQKAAGDRLRNILAWMTNNRLVGALTGILVTALIQSSSATTVMIVSFVNAGLLSLGQSMAVIMGANVGTTATAWILYLGGFKVNLAAAAIPIVAFTLPMMFSQKNSWKSWGEVLLGFAFLFMGLDLLNHSVPDLRSNPELFAAIQNYADMGWISVVLFAFIGMIITIVVQSSSVTFAITLVICSKGWISFEMAAALVLGSNIGTCITPIIASASGNIWAKRSAMGHLLFNVLGSVWVLALYYPFMKLVIWLSTLGQGDPTALLSFVNNTDPTIINALNEGTLDLADPVNQQLATTFTANQAYVSFGLSIFHTLFNAINICVMIWLTGLYVKIVTKLIPSKPTEEEGESHLKFITAGMLSTSELSILQARKEIQLYGERTQRMFGLVRDLFHETDDKEFTSKYSRIQKYENISDRMEMEIAEYLTKVSAGRLSDESKHQVQMKLRVISEIESVADSCYNLARTLQRRFQQPEKFPEDINGNIELMFNLIESGLQNMCNVLCEEHIDQSYVNSAQNIENEINNYRNQLKLQNVIAVNEGYYNYPVATTYMDTIVECEKMGDYIVNVVEAVADSKLHPTAE